MCDDSQGTKGTLNDRALSLCSSQLPFRVVLTRRVPGRESIPMLVTHRPVAGTLRNMSTDIISAALSRLQAGTTKVEFIHKPYTSWPYPRPTSHFPTPLTGSSTITDDSAFRVAVLDSSFNPPTLAHRALVLLPAAASPSEARLLLLSVRNADKAPRTGDASPKQRIEMMVRLAREVDAAVGLVDAPAFVHKAERLHTALPARAQLTFVQGIDTLERFFAPRYYGDGSLEIMHAALQHFFSPDGDDARVICARRSIKLTDPQGESAILESARDWIQAGRITLVDVGNQLQTFSSSEVRAKVHARNDSWRLMVPDGIKEYIEEQSLYLDPA
jgi:nicotinamide-nucleotide adenylyltransferase